MGEIVWWIGRLLVLGGLLAYVWAVAGRLAKGVAREGRGEESGSPGGETSSPRLVLVQDNAVDGVRLGPGGLRLGLRQAVGLAGEVTLGRNEENALVIGDRFTSGRHARLCEREGAYWVEDLGSRNGTLLNGRRIRGAERLWPGDRLTVGSCTFRFMR